jgi:hypothetical protein
MGIRMSVTNPKAANMVALFTSVVSFCTIMTYKGPPVEKHREET